MNDTGNTSLEVGVRVEAENIRTGKKLHTSSLGSVSTSVDPNSFALKISASNGNAGQAANCDICTRAKDCCNAVGDTQCSFSAAA